MKRFLVLGIAVVVAAAAFAIPALAASKSVKIGDNFFVRSSNNATVSVKRGTTVVWKWTGTAPHNVTVTSGPRRFRSGTIMPGRSYSKRFTKTGTYKIVCTIHPGMKMTLKVR